MRERGGQVPGKSGGIPTVMSDYGGFERLAESLVKTFATGKRLGGPAVVTTIEISEREMGECSGFPQTVPVILELSQSPSEIINCLVRAAKKAKSRTSADADTRSSYAMGFIQCGFEHGEAFSGASRSDQRVAECCADVGRTFGVFRGCAQCFAEMTDRRSRVSSLTGRNAQCLVCITADLL
jgi:hypothetical protein